MKIKKYINLPFWAITFTFFANPALAMVPCKVYERPYVEGGCSEYHSCPPLKYTTSFTMNLGEPKGYGGGNASLTPIFISKTPDIFVKLNLIPPLKLNYGAGYYTIISDKTKASLPFEWERVNKYWLVAFKRIPRNGSKEVQIHCKFF